MNLAEIDPAAPLCASGKRPHRDEATARRELGTIRWTAQHLARRGRKAGRVEVDVYQCPACQWWHLTGMEQAGGRPRRGGGRR